MPWHASFSPLVHPTITTHNKQSSTTANMKFSAAVSSIFLAGSVVAVPTTVQTDKPQTFDVVAVKPSSPIQDFAVGAASRGLLLDLVNQNATCEGENDQATFYIEGSKLFLYSDDKPQQIFVDRSGMGTFA